MKSTEQKKKTPKGCLPAVIILAIVAVVLMVRSKINSEDKAAQTEGYKKDWPTLSYEKKAEWIKHRLADIGEQGEANGQLAARIKKQFNFPEEVSFATGSYPNFAKGDIVDADTGMVFLRGSGTAKNAFGVKSGFGYSVKTILRPDTFYLAEVNVFNLQ